MKKNVNINAFQARALDDLSYSISIASLVVQNKEIVPHLVIMRESFSKIVEILTSESDEASN